jgi:hypothetical protein
LTPDTKAFISHSSKDKEFAKKLMHALNAYKLSVWFDTRELKPGDDLRKSIKGGIDSSTFFLVLLSPDSIKSKWVRFELREALRQQKETDNTGPVIIPVKIKECTIPKRMFDLLHVDFTKGWGTRFLRTFERNL